MGGAIAAGLSALESWIWTKISGIFTGALSDLTAPFKSAFNLWMSQVYAFGNYSLAAYEGQNVTTNEGNAVVALGYVVTPFLLMALAAGIAIDVLLGLALPLDIGPSQIAGFLIPIVVTLLASKLAATGGNSWPSQVFNRLLTGVQTTITGISSIGEWLFNLTQSVSSSVASDAVAPHLVGDDWAFTAFVVGSAGTGSGFKVLSLLEAGLPRTITPAAPAPQQSVAASDAATGIVYGLIALLLALGIYLVSLVAPTSGTLADVAFIGEMAMAIIGTVFGVITFCASLYAMTNPEIRAITGATGWISVGLSLGAAGAGAFDIYSLATSGLPP